MGKFIKSIGSVFGLGSKPKVSTQQEQAAIVGEEQKAKKLRSALFETSGGILGQELNPEEVKKRDTLFGN